MTGKGITTAIVGLIAAASVAAAGPAFAEERTIKELMAENFAGLQHILVSLIMSKYETLPADVEVIREHADELTHRVPASAKDREDKYLAYAYNLKASAEQLKTVVELLIERNTKRAKDGQLSRDDLRDVASAHYGGMVNMCVACHNRFRQWKVE